MDSSVDGKIIRQKFFLSPKSSRTLFGRLPLNYSERDHILKFIAVILQKTVMEERKILI